MSKREDYEARVEAFLLPVMEENHFELVDVEYVKEAGTWYLRAYICLLYTSQTVRKPGWLLCSFFITCRKRQTAGGSPMEDVYKRQGWCRSA